MNTDVDTPVSRRIARSPLTPAFICVAGYAILTAVGVEHLVAGVSPAVLQAPAKLSAYVTAASLMGLAAGVAIAFGLCCGLTIRWLNGPTDVRAIARSLGGGLWVFACYAVLLAVWITVDPPQPLTREDMLSPRAGTSVEFVTPWLETIQYVTLAAFFLVVFLLLSRVADRLSALISLAFAASVVVALGAGLVALAALLPG